MSKLLMYDFECPNGHTFEDLVPSTRRQVKCSKCDLKAKRQISPVRTDWRNMGVSNDFPTAASKWERMQRKKAKNDKQDSPNLWMY